MILGILILAILTTAGLIWYLFRESPEIKSVGYKDRLPNGERQEFIVVTKQAEPNASNEQIDQFFSYTSSFLIGKVPE